MMHKFFRILIYLLPAVLFCSYYPIIRLGETSSMNLELSLPLIWLVMFDLTAFVTLFTLKRTSFQSHSQPKSHTASQSHSRSKVQAKTLPGFNFPGLSDRKFFLLSLFPFYATLSIFWSSNPLRAALTAGIIWLLFFAIFALVYVLPLIKFPSQFRRNVIISILVSTVGICLICWVQSFLDLAGVDRAVTLLCRGCTYQSFGFPHPSGLAIEPQFMGNLLLAPCLLVFYLLIFSRSQLRRWECHLCLILATLFSATLFFTFSRGAIYAYVIALILMAVFALCRHQFRSSLVIIPCITFAVVLIIQGLFTTIGPTQGNFLDGISRSVHQLSLGIIDFRSSSATSETGSITVSGSEDHAITSESDSTAPVAVSESIPEDSQDNISTQPIFTGYVTESTDARLTFSSVALDTWSSTPSRVIFGVGLGGAGTAMHERDPDRVASSKEIVQHQGISLLLELGLVGVALIILDLALLFIPGRYLKFLRLSPAETSTNAPSFWQIPALPLLLTLIIAYLITLNFFSGLPNALQIYLMPPLLYAIFQKPFALQHNV